jgi:hypothetical protein
MPPLIPETNKKPGLCYAFTDGGVELPVIDVTHPSFRITLSDEEIEAKAQQFLDQQAAKGPLAAWLQRKIMPFFLRRSVIGRGMLKSAGGYLDGLSTYLMKLGPDHLGAWATPMDRKLAEGLRLSGLSVNIRTQDMAELLAQGLAPLLAQGPGRPLHFIDIAGGPSMDALNALILLRRDHPAALAGRSISIDVLDLEEAGPHFAAAALLALQEHGPLQGVPVSLRHLSYDWNDPVALEYLLKALPRDAIAAASSEGGLFDYGSDQIVLANLKTLAAFGPADTVLAGTISRPDGAGNRLRRGAIASLVLRDLKDWQSLADPSGWTIHGSRKRPMNFVVLATKK